MKLYIVTYDWRDLLGTIEMKNYFLSKEQAEKDVEATKKVYGKKVSNFVIREENH